MQLTGASGWQSKGCRRRGAHTAQRQGARIARCAPCTKRCAPGSWWAAATTPPARPARLARRGPRSRGQAPRQRRGGAPRAAAPAPPAATAWSSAARSAPAARQAQLHIHPTLSYPIRARSAVCMCRRTGSAQRRVPAPSPAPAAMSVVQARGPGGFVENKQV